MKARGLGKTSKQNAVVEAEFTGRRGGSGGVCRGGEAGSGEGEPAAEAPRLQLDRSSPLF